MSHDPSHWDYEIKIMRRIFTNIIRSYARDAIWNWDPGYFKWSLAQYVYTHGPAYMKTWDDMSM
jgi:hypothetical protein